jgi:hypothetical protein
VGAPAKRQAVTNPENTVFSIKRFMGRKYDEVSEEMKIVPYEVVQGENGDVRVRAENGGYDLVPAKMMTPTWLVEAIRVRRESANCSGRLSVGATRAGERRRFPDEVSSWRPRRRRKASTRTGRRRATRRSPTAGQVTTGPGLP